jgi:hypothetical protein
VAHPARARTPVRLRRFGALARPHRNRGKSALRSIPVKDVHPVPFLVGRLSKNDRRIMVLEPATPAPIPGPWDLRAVFTL